MNVWLNMPAVLSCQPGGSSSTLLWSLDRSSSFGNCRPTDSCHSFKLERHLRQDIFSLFCFTEINSSLKTGGSHCFRKHMARGAHALLVKSSLHAAASRDSRSGGLAFSRDVLAGAAFGPKTSDGISGLPQTGHFPVFSPHCSNRSRQSIFSTGFTGC